MEDTSLINEITQMDMELGPYRNNMGQLYGAVTHTSLYDLLDEMEARLEDTPLNDNDTVFVDFGSGMGSISFTYMIGILLYSN